MKQRVQFVIPVPSMAYSQKLPALDLIEDTQVDIRPCPNGFWVSMRLDTENFIERKQLDLIKKHFAKMETLSSDDYIWRSFTACFDITYL